MGSLFVRARASAPAGNKGWDAKQAGESRVESVRCDRGSGDYCPSDAEPSVAEVNERGLNS